MDFSARKMLRRLAQTLVLSACLASNPNWARSVIEAPFYSPGMELKGAGQAEIVGKDAFLVLPIKQPEADSPADRTRTLVLDLSIAQRPDSEADAEDVYGELFFRSLSQGRGFNPQYKIKFRYPDAGFKKVKF